MCRRHIALSCERITIETFTRWFRADFQWEAKKEKKARGNKNARNSLKNKTFILFFLYRKAIKKQFAMWIEEHVSLLNTFSLLHCTRFKNLLLIFSSHPFARLALLPASKPPRYDTWWFICMFFTPSAYTIIFLLITSRNLLWAGSQHDHFEWKIAFYHPPLWAQPLFRLTRKRIKRVVYLISRIIKNFFFHSFMFAQRRLVIIMRLLSNFHSKKMKTCYVYEVTRKSEQSEKRLLCCFPIEETPRNVDNEKKRRKFFSFRSWQKKKAD